MMLQIMIFFYKKIVFGNGIPFQGKSNMGDEYSNN